MCVCVFVCQGFKLKFTRHGRANGRADGERFHVKLACRDTNDLKALNRTEEPTSRTAKNK